MIASLNVGDHNQSYIELINNCFSFDAKMKLFDYMYRNIAERKQKMNNNGKCRLEDEVRNLLNSSAII